MEDRSCKFEGTELSVSDGIIKNAFKVEHTENLGRHLVALQDLEYGDTILKESPLVTGPPQVQYPVCVVCHKKLENPTECEKCGWPICSSLCSSNPLHNPECSIVEKKVPVMSKLPFCPMYKFLLIIRCLYMADNNPTVWNKLIKLESHCNKRKILHLYEEERQNVAHFMQSFFHLKARYSEEVILKVWGIIQINSYPVWITDPPFIAIYDTASFIEHSCFPNITKLFSADGSLIMRVASKVIRKGDHLSICYTDAKLGTVARQEMLANELLQCSCGRCKDPTELETYFSALKCSAFFCRGYILPENMPLNDANNNKSCAYHWKCNVCDTAVPPYFVNDLLNDIKDKWAHVDQSSELAVMDFLTTCNEFVHPNHYLLLPAKVTLCTLQPYSEESHINFHELLDFVDNLFPGDFVIRGIIRCKLHFALLAKAKEAEESFNYSEKEIASFFEKAKKFGLSGISMLKYLPDTFPAGALALETEISLGVMDLTRKK